MEGLHRRMTCDAAYHTQEAGSGLHEVKAHEVNLPDGRGHPVFGHEVLPEN